MGRYAIIMSCEEYKDKEYPNISFCHNDAFLIEETLVNYCDYPQENILLEMIGPGYEEGEPEEILEKIKEKLKDSTEGDTILFYYAGHGLVENNEAFLILPDTNPEDLEATALPLRNISKVLKENKRINVRVFDACHSGMDVRGTTCITSDSFNDLMIEEGWVTLASCSKYERSYPDASKQQGIYTYMLVESIKEFKENDEIYPELLKLKICDKMKQWCEETGVKQTPTMNSSIIGNVSIATRNEIPKENSVKQEIVNCSEICLGQESILIKENHIHESEDKEGYNPVNIQTSDCTEGEVAMNDIRLWESPSGVKLPKRADINTIMQYNI
ncbi:caspase family protein [Tepidibacter mesophilus]|uniref:caspase family protein n=1 Tax=Tepidibacter mesophilus TaxID=655607 RepID=UPI000C06D51F|nr:caspase family protein [Tepidibacter mesophilus]